MSQAGGRYKDTAQTEERQPTCVRVGDTTYMACVYNACRSKHVHTSTHAHAEGHNSKQLALLELLDDHT